MTNADHEVHGLRPVRYSRDESGFKKQSPGFKEQRHRKEEERQKRRGRRAR
jgi:hypothetical protein